MNAPGTRRLLRAAAAPILALAVSGVAAGLGTVTAAEPTPALRVLDNGTVAGTLVLPVPEGRIRAFLADSAANHRMVPAVKSFTVTREGPCDRVDIVARGLFRPLRYAKRRCPTTAGYVEELAEPGDFREFHSEWFLAPQPAATRVEYHLWLALAMPLPRAVLRKTLKDAVKDTLLQLRSAVERPAP